MAVRGYRRRNQRPRRRGRGCPVDWYAKLMAMGELDQHLLFDQIVSDNITRLVLDPSFRQLMSWYPGKSVAIVDGYETLGFQRLESERLIRIWSRFHAIDAGTQIDGTCIVVFREDSVTFED